MKLIVFALLFFLFVATVVEASIGIGVEPTKATMTLPDIGSMQLLIVKLWNPSTTDINYTFSVADKLKNYVYWNCSEADYPFYWCEGKSYFVPIGVSRNNATQISILFMRKTNESAEFNSSITVKGNPISNETGMVGIVPQIEIQILLLANILNIYRNTTTTTTTSSTSSTTTTTISSSSSGSSSSGGQTSTTSTTLTTTTTVRYVPIGQILNKSNPSTTSTPTTLPTNQEDKAFSIPITYIVIGVIMAIVVIVGILVLRWY